MQNQTAFDLETEALCARLRALSQGVAPDSVAGLRAAYAAFQKELAPHEALLSWAAPEWAWVVLGRDPDEFHQIELVAVELTEGAALAVVARVRAHEGTVGAYPHQLRVYAARVGTNYLYDLDGVPRMTPF